MSKVELKFIKQEEAAACSLPFGQPKRGAEARLWVTGEIETPAGTVPVVSTELILNDRIEHMRCRLSAFRNSYTVPSGLYAVGRPDEGSDVFVSANYKMSFDVLRAALSGLDAWVLVLDTKGINVWCAAGKGTFGTEELIGRISSTGLSKVVGHRRLILPQLSAPGVKAHEVKKRTGFRVHYGPVRAGDIKAYVRDGYKATAEMRRVRFGIIDRLVLTPMEILPAMKKYPLYALAVLLVFGLEPSGIMFNEAFGGGWPFLLLGLVSVFSGAFLTPVLLPFLPFRSFVLKGWVMGMLSVFMAFKLTGMDLGGSLPLMVFSYLFFPLLSSYIALLFTGTTTFTGMSGVKKEMKYSLRVYAVSGAICLVLLVIYKYIEWVSI